MNHQKADSADEEHGSFEPVYLKADASAELGCYISFVLAAEVSADFLEHC